MQYQPSTNDEQVGQNHPKFEGGKVIPAVAKPPQAHQELQGKQNKAKQSLIPAGCGHSGLSSFTPADPASSKEGDCNIKRTLACGLSLSSVADGRTWPTRTEGTFLHRASALAMSTSGGMRGGLVRSVACVSGICSSPPHAVAAHRLVASSLSGEVCH